MFKRLQVTNFQSLRKLDLELKPYTIIVGASNSGKSALIRAVKVLTQNATKPSFVRTGTKSAGVLLTKEDDTVVALERGKSLSTYRIITEGNEDTFAKSGKDVPDAVSETLAVTEMAGGIVNFASQFDKPFLLDATTTTVAQTLGELTNLSLVFDTIRAANRRKLEAKSKLKVREKDYEDAKERLQSYKTLPAEKQFLGTVAEEVKALELQEAELNALEILINDALFAQTAIDALPNMPPDLNTEGVEEEVQDFIALRGLITNIELATETFNKATEGDMRVVDAIAEAEQEYHDTLTAEGICPVCGKEVGDE